jgi:hypothetical protein
MATISQLPASVTLRKFRGDEFAVNLVFDGIDLTGYTLFNDIYRLESITDVNGFASIQGVSAGSFNLTVVSAVLGQIRLSLDETASAALSAGSYRWLLRWVAPGDVTRTIINGSLELVDDLSQASGTGSDGSVINVSASSAVPGGGIPVAAGVAGLLNDLVWGG